jgi:hypothetical protein
VLISTVDFNVARKGVLDVEGIQFQRDLADAAFHPHRRQVQLFMTG